MTVIFYLTTEAFSVAPSSAKNGAHCSRRGAGVKRLTATREKSEANSAGRMASRGAHHDVGGSSFATWSQNTVTNVPAASELTAPAAVTRFEKNAAITTGVIAAE